MQIHWHHPEAVRDSERERANARLESLAAGHRDLIDVWIEVRPSTHHRRGGDEVAIRCDARGAELVARRTAEETDLALREAMAALEREVRRLRERRTHRRVERPAAPPHLGVVDRVVHAEGYGFVVADGGDQVYFHQNAVRHGLAFDDLEVGQRVALGIERGDEGPQATVVMPPPPDERGR